jgi:hypothetical protein
MGTIAASVKILVWASTVTSAKPASKRRLRQRRTMRGAGTRSARACTMVRVSAASSASMTKVSQSCPISTMRPPGASTRRA